MKRKTTRTINCSKTLYPMVLKCSETCGFTLAPRDSATLIWSERYSEDVLSIVHSPKTKVSCFPKLNALTQKDTFTQLVALFQKMHPESCAWYPRSWISGRPGPRPELTGNPNQVYIVKPPAGGGGGGISLTRDPTQPCPRGYLIQEYISNPLCLNGFKVDFRMYAVITSVEPLKVYLYEDGLARFCSEPYQPPAPGQGGRLHNAMSHFTNYCLNKRSATFNPDVHKQRMKDVLPDVASATGISIDELWHATQQVISEALHVLRPELVLDLRRTLHEQKAQLSEDDSRKAPFHGETCFHIVGVDIMYDADGKPWLLELNANPSLVADTTADEMVKTGLLTSVLARVFRGVKVPDDPHIDPECELKVLDMPATVSSGFSDTLSSDDCMQTFHTLTSQGRQTTVSEQRLARFLADKASDLVQIHGSQAQSVNAKTAASLYMTKVARDYQTKQFGFTQMLSVLLDLLRQCEETPPCIPDPEQALKDILQQAVDTPA